MVKKPKKWIIWSAIILVLVVFIFIALSPGSNESKNGRSTIEVKKMNIVDKALAVGSIEPVNEIDVKSKVSGVVGRLFADVGDFVHAGDPLVEVKPDPTPLELAQGKRDVEMATIELEGLKKELERAKQLKSKGLISDQEYELLTQNQAISKKGIKSIAYYALYNEAKERYFNKQLRINQAKKRNLDNITKNG